MAMVWQLHIMPSRDDESRPKLDLNSIFSGELLKSDTAAPEITHACYIAFVNDATVLFYQQ